MIDVAEAIRRIVTVGAPVLFLDTCSLLDIMRDPTREKFGARHAGAALDLLTRAEAAPPTLSILLAEQVQAELLGHLEDAERETERAIGRFDETLQRVLGVMNAVGVAPAVAPPDLPALGFPARARAVVERFLAVAHVVAEKDTYVMRGWARVRKGIAPATRAKQSVKDCVVIETYFDLVKELRSAGFGANVLFFTTNTADYAEGVRPRLHSQLEPDFAATAMLFATEFLAARYAL